MFTIAEVIKLLTKIFVKQNKRFPKGLEGVDIRIKAKEIYDVGKSQGYKGDISEDQLKHFLAFEKQREAAPYRVIPADSPEGKIISDKLTGKNVLQFPEGGVDRVSVTKQFTGKSFTADDHIKFIKSKEPIEAMKEANSVIGRKGRYKNLSHEEADRILKDTEDHIFQRDVPEEDFASGGIARAKFGLGDLVKEKIPAEYRLYAKSILPGGESGKVGSDYFTGDFKQELRKQALDKYKRTGKLRGTVGEVDQHRGDPTINKLIGFPSTYASLGTYTYDIDPKTLDVKITDRYDWNPAYGKQKIADTEVIGWIGDKKGKDVDLPMLKDFAVSAVKEGWSPSSALELIGNYFGGKASEGKGFDVDIDIPTRKATSATEGSFAKGGLAKILGV